MDPWRSGRRGKKRNFDTIDKVRILIFLLGEREKGERRGEREKGGAEGEKGGEKERERRGREKGEGREKAREIEKGEREGGGKGVEVVE